MNQSGRLATSPRWVAPVFPVLGAAPGPWTRCPAGARPPHPPGRGNRFVGLLATITATMLVLDAWFDVNPSSHADRPQAILSAAFIELPLALVCGWIALHVDHVIERRLRRLARRAEMSGPQTRA